MKKLIQILQFVSLLNYFRLFDGEENSVELKEKSLRFRKLVEVMGPAYVKIGQILSMRFDLLPKQTCLELQVLLDSGDPIPFEVVKDTIEKDLGYRAVTLLNNIEQEPLAVASIGQVHMGIIQGEKVAIKVLKPGTRETIRKDFEILDNLLKLTELVPQLRKLHLRDLFGEFRTWTLRELDYRVEAINTQTFADTYKELENVYSPKLYQEYLTKNVIVTEYIEGVSFKELLNAFSETHEDELEIKGIKFSRSHLLHKLPDVAYSQIFDKGMVHGDPHASNIIMMSPDKLAFIDFGIVSQLNEKQRVFMEETLHYVATGDMEKAVGKLISEDRIPGSESQEKIEQVLKPMFEKYQAATAIEYSTTEFFLNILYRAGQLGLESPLYVVIIAKVLASYDSVAQILDPKFSIMESAASYYNQRLTQNIIDKFETQGLLMKAAKTLNTLEEMVESIPDQLSGLAKELREDGIRVTTRSDPPKEIIKYKGASINVTAICYLSIVGLMAYLLEDSKVLGIDLKLFLFINWVIFTIIVVTNLRKSQTND